MELYPLKFKPIYKEKIWGGNKLKTYFNRKLPTNKIGESWEVSTHKNGPSVVSNGPLTGQKLSSLLEKDSEKILGFKAKRFPLLFKFLDVNQKLSVQVHPDDEYARKIENEPGKTEMWYVLAAEPGAKLVYGLKKRTTKNDLRRAIKNNNLRKHINEVKVNSGDIFFIPSGTVHSIKEGLLLAEIQQNSDTTYRIYDWGRTGKDGKPRPLHIEKALEVIKFETPPEKNNSQLTIKHRGYTQNYLTACRHFAVEKFNVKDNYSPVKQNTFQVINILKGSATIKYKQGKTEVKTGESILIPAKLKNIKITGNIDFLLTYIPQNRNNFIEKLKKEKFTEKQINKLAGINHW